jgi:nucleoside 2-deoxyribosyltransferase
MLNEGVILRRLRVYLAGPISRGDLADNVNQATAAYIALASAGVAPFCPQWSVYASECTRVPVPTGEPGIVVCYGEPLPNDLTHADWLAVDFAWVEAADAVLRLPGASAGADREVEWATLLGIPVFRTVTQVIAWAAARTGEPG